MATTFSKGYQDQIIKGHQGHKKKKSARFCVSYYSFFFPFFFFFFFLGGGGTQASKPKLFEVMPSDDH